MNIEIIFDKINGDHHALSEESILTFLKEWNAPLSVDELKELRANDIKPAYWDNTRLGKWKPKKFEEWHFPEGHFPKEYIQLISKYSGCEFIKGEREFTLFSPQELREMNITYELPMYIKGAISIGLDGSGNHIIFDMRFRSENQHKVFGVHSGYLEWEGAKLIANNFLEFIHGTQNIDELVNQ